jgi:lysozyme|tara:strand:- start:96 stop:827 length:732 start_codon:yes stop_codon:yes gene_type:complete
MHPIKVSDDGVTLVKKFEGLHRVQPDGMVSAYRCPAGKFTCGFGATRGVRSGTKWTKEYCEMRLIDDLNDHGKAVKKYVQVPLSQGQYDALVSFVFNLGEGAFRSSTLLKHLNKGLYDDVPEQLMRWNKARIDGKLTPLKGLTRRRAAEAAIFSRDALMPSDEGGPEMVQKPTSEAPKSLMKSKTMAGAGIAGMATGLNEVAGQMQGLVAYADSLKTVFLLCAIGGIALAAYARYKDNKEGIH